MAGNVLKIILEDTKPPVWRRIIVPERITFAELHQIIQILFGWSDSHPHNFFIPSKQILIDDYKDTVLRCHYSESKTLVEQFFPEYKWICYTYDLTDGWSHKIIHENTDESYDQRYVSLLNAEGINFVEDRSRISEFEENQCKFDPAETVNRLRQQIFPIHDVLTEETEKKPAQPLLSDSRLYQWEQLMDAFDTDPVKANIQSLPIIQEEKSNPTVPTLEIVPGNKTQEELLYDLGEKEIRDYCKYLQIPITDSWTQLQMAAAVSQMLHQHPEYLLYVLYEEEYDELIRWTKLPCGIAREKPSHTDTWYKAISLGLLDVSVQKSRTCIRATLSFARDVPDILKGLKINLKKQTYRKLNNFSKKLDTLILVYGMIDFDTVPQMFFQIYHDKFETDTFRRYMYWYALMNDLVAITHDCDGKCYVSDTQLNLVSVGADMKQYADDLKYIIFPASQLKKMSENIGARSEWMDIFFEALHFQLDLSKDEAAEILNDIFPAIMNGDDIIDILDMVYAQLPETPNLIETCYLWKCIASLMLDLPLPMLKGRNRSQYAQQTGISPWRTGMLKKAVRCRDSKELHMSQFPWEIQESMLLTDSVGRNRLLQYQGENKIQSEEFLCLLAEALIQECEFAAAEPLIQKLRNSSSRGKKAAEYLEKKAENGWAIMDDEDTIYPDALSLLHPWKNPGFSSPSPIQTYRRETPKIGRNSPCPCGSGKKYKNCCRRNQ